MRYFYPNPGYQYARSGNDHYLSYMNGERFSVMSTDFNNISIKHAYHNIAKEGILSFSFYVI